MDFELNIFANNNSKSVQNHNSQINMIKERFGRSNHTAISPSVEGTAMHFLGSDKLQIYAHKRENTATGVRE